MRATFYDSLNSIPEETWDRLFATDMPFLRHRFLALLESHRLHHRQGRLGHRCICRYWTEHNPYW